MNISAIQLVECIFSHTTKRHVLYFYVPLISELGFVLYHQSCISSSLCFLVVRLYGRLQNQVALAGSQEISTTEYDDLKLRYVKVKVYQIRKLFVTISHQQS